MKKQIEKLMPEGLRDAWRIFCAHKRALAQDRKLNALTIPELDISGSCRLLSNRQELLGHLPTNSIGAEVGVATGDFSAEILRIVDPRKLYLIDPWEAESSVQGKLGGKRGLERI